jgi:hypothetical protein
LDDAPAAGTAYIHSAALAMLRDDTPMTLRVDKGVRAARGGNETKDRLEAVVVVPGRSSLRFSGLHMTLVDNARYEPEQILLMTSSSPVAEKALAGKVSGRFRPLSAQPRLMSHPRVKMSRPEARLFFSAAPSANLPATGRTKR